MFSFTTISMIKLILYKNFNQLVTFTVLEKNEVPLNANALLTDSTLAKVMKADLKEKYYHVIILHQKATIYRWHPPWY